MSEPERQLIDRVTAALDEGVAGLDAATRSRLAQARARALQSHHHKAWVWWVPAGGAVFASVLAAVLWLGRPAPLPGNGYLDVQDFELLTAAENIDLDTELEFYQWLDEESLHAG